MVAKLKVIIKFKIYFILNLCLKVNNLNIDKKLDEARKSIGLCS